MRQKCHFLAIFAGPILGETNYWYVKATTDVVDCRRIEIIALLTGENGVKIGLEKSTVQHHVSVALDSYPATAFVSAFEIAILEWTKIAACKSRK